MAFVRIAPAPHLVMQPERTRQGYGHGAFCDNGNGAFCDNGHGAFCDNGKGAFYDNRYHPRA